MSELVERKFEETVAAIAEGHERLAAIRADRLTGMARVLEALKYPRPTIVEEVEQ